MKKLLLLESKSDQAKTFNWYLKKNTNFEIINCSKISIDNYSGFDIIVPSGGNSTFDYVNKFGDFRIGQLTYSKNNLITYDKLKTLEIVKNIGVPIPLSYTKREQLSNFPVFYKSLREEGYAERGILRNIMDLKNLKSNSVFFQEFIWSKGTYSVGFLADRGELITYFIQKEIISYPYHGGSGVILEKIEDARLLDYTKRIIKTIGYSGWGLTEFKYSNRIEDFVFMEVNAKFWASIKFAIFNNPLILKLLFDIDLKPKNINSVLYIDRLILSELSEIFAASKFFFKSKLVNSKPIIKALGERIIGKRIKAQRIKLVK